MKKVVLFAIICSLFSFTFSGCETVNKKSELYVFAASSLTECMTQIESQFENEHNDIDLILNLDSSGTLKTQIEEGAYCDVFISASTTPMDKIDSIVKTRVDLLENKVSLVVSENNPASIYSFEDLVSKLNSNDDILLAIGNADVPVGEYTLQIFDYYNLDSEKLDENGLLTYGSSVKEVTTQVKEGLVDCAIIYETDAKISGLEIVDLANESQCSQVIYPAAVLSKSNNIDVANVFFEYLKSDKVSEVFIDYGFTPIS